MKKKIVALCLALFMVFAVATPAFATSDKVVYKSYVCKYVGTPGADESLQTGQNPIHVSNASLGLGPKGLATVGQVFGDAHDKSVVILANTDKVSPEPTISDCPAPQGPVEPTPTEPPVTETPTPVIETPTPTIPVEPPVVVPPVDEPTIPVEPPVVVPTPVAPEPTETAKPEPTNVDKPERDKTTFVAKSNPVAVPTAVDAGLVASELPDTGVADLVGVLVIGGIVLAAGSLILMKRGKRENGVDDSL